MLSPEAQSILSQVSGILDHAASPILCGRFGQGMSERCVETPWAASYFLGGERLLDVGYSLASMDFLGLLLELRRSHKVQLEAVDIVDPRKVAGRYPDDWRDEVLAVPVRLGDFRYLELPARAYDIATCISTLEHIGFDEAAEADAPSAFDRPDTPDEARRERDPETTTRVLDQFHRTLKPGGLALISVPLGRDEPGIIRDSLGLYATQWEYGPETWPELTRHPGFSVVEERFFALNDDDTWQEVDSPEVIAERPRRDLPHARGVGLVALRSRPE